MSIIGNPLVSAAYVTDQFSGDGTTVAFTMSVAPANTAAALVIISGVVQDPATYGISGKLLTFSAAPPAGSGNISVRYLGIPGSSITATAYRTITEFTASASQTVFTVPSYTVGYITVYRNGVRLGLADYTASNGTTVILANAATTGDLVTTESFYVSSVLNAIPALAGQVGATYLAAGAASQAFLDYASGNGTGAMKLPVGSTAQRPTGAPGLIRQNSTTGNPEWWDGTTNNWQQFSQPAGYSINYLVVAGGGGGGFYLGGGGGAGGMLTGSGSLSSGTAYTITVGSGGAGSVSGSTTGTNGNNSLISGIVTAVGGGGGGSFNTAAAGASGGSGGGAVYGNFTNAAGTSGQGSAGGQGNAGSSAASGGGGGGASAVGQNAPVGGGGAGGAGNSSSISGTSLSYAGGGGGGSNTGFGGAGGTGGGGAGGVGSGPAGSNGSTNTGGGAGGGSSTGNGGSGGSGIVIISYLGSQRGTGGTVTTSGGYTIHTFTSSGTYNA